MTLPCEIMLRANNSILVEEKFYGARPVKYRNECDTNAPAVRIFHGTKGAKFGEIEKYFSLPSLRSLRLCSGQAWREKLLKYPAASRGVTK